MGDSIPDAKFQFVNATTSNPCAPQDQSVRALIRRQAMKQASDARRRDGSYGKHNLRQYPVFYQQASREQHLWKAHCTDNIQEYAKQAISVGEEDSSIETKNVRLNFMSQEISVEPQSILCRDLSRATIPPSPSQQGYEAMAIKYGFNIVDLSTLASLHLGRAAAKALSADPSQVVDLLSCKQWSYLGYLPSLYESSRCIRDAVDCVTARVRQIISPTSRNWESIVIPLYVKAINSLQKTLDNPIKSLEPDVLCATEILALYELLNSSSSTAWTRHAAGAAHLIQIRGPNSYNTEFEKALFMAHANPIMTESLLNGESCFLEQPAWRAVFQSLVAQDHVFSSRSEVAISLLILKSRIPSVFKEIDVAISTSNNFGNSNTDRAASSAFDLRLDFLRWLGIYDSILPLARNVGTGFHEYNRRSEITSTYLSCIMISNRLVSAVSASERPLLEGETLLLATQTTELEKAMKSVSAPARLYLAQTIIVADSVQTTSQEWMVMGTQEVNGVIEKWKFKRWCELIGRKTS